MKRYIIASGQDSVYITPPMADAPANGYEFTPAIASMKKPRPDQWPNHTCIVEAITQVEIDAQIAQREQFIREEFQAKMRELTANAQFELSAFGTPIPLEIQTAYLALKDEMDAAVAAVANDYQQAKNRTRK